MRNEITLPLTASQELVVTTDNSGRIGEKSLDAVYAPNEVVGYFAGRVAMMECLAVCGEPHTVVMQNFTDDQAWLSYRNGVNQVIEELKLDKVSITGSTESNFSGMQSGLGITVIGTRTSGQTLNEWTGEENFAVIGTPLVGDEVINQQSELASLSLFRYFCQMEEVKAVLPVGSKGIAAAWETWTERKSQLSCAVDLEKSAGPATCFLIAFDEQDYKVIHEVAGSAFHNLQVR